MDDGFGPGQARVDVPGVGEVGGQVADPGMVAAAQVQPRHLVPAAGEIGHDAGADAAGAAGDGDSHGAPQAPGMSVVSGAGARWLSSWSSMNRPALLSATILSFWSRS